MAPSHLCSSNCQQECQCSASVSKTCAGEVFMEKAYCIDETANGGKSRTLSAVDENGFNGVEDPVFCQEWIIT